MDLYQLGWNDFFDNAFQPYRQNKLIPGRVARRDKQTWLLYCEAGALTADLTGKCRRSSASTGDWPTVGDWVALSARMNESAATIHGILSRKTSFSRKAASSGGMPDSGGRTDEQVLAANIDTAFLVSGLDKDFNIRRIERYLLTAYDSGATPVVVLNKSDLCDNIGEHVAEIESVACGVEICAVSAIDGNGMDSLRPYLKTGKTVALLGSSGVGKSTIINWLLGTEQLKTAPVREHDSRGRHTTTHREMILLPSGGILIDSPGIRELQVWSDEEGLKRIFDDIESLAERCRFRDCSHAGEPGCYIQAALQSGEIDADRFESYMKLHKELQRLQARQSGKARHLERLRGKKFSSVVNEMIKLKMRRR